MESQYQQPESSIVLFEGSPLERIASSTLPVRAELQTLHSRFYLPSDIVIGQYGVTGFLIVDTKPEARYESYTNSDLFGVSYSREHHIHLPPEVRNDPLRSSHFIDTDKGLKLIRYIILPLNVKEFFRKDKFLGDPMIAKCCEEGAVPEWFDEEQAYDISIFVGSYGKKWDELGEGEKLVERVIKGVTPKLKETCETKFDRLDFRHKAYVSFHPWQYNREAIEIGETGIIRAIRNFDQFLSMLDKRGTLQKREFPLEGAQEYRIALPTQR